MITNAHTIVKPGTVMVKTFNATVADGAVAGARCPENKAVGAHLTRVNLCK